MRDILEIVNNPRLKIFTCETRQEDNEEWVRITCQFCDPITRKDWLIYFTRSLGWEHLSISSENKMPAWELMCRVKEMFWDDEEACVEFHPKKSEYVNNHPYCLHIWKPYHVELPTPPCEAVGIIGLDSDGTKLLTEAFMSSLSKEQVFENAERRGIRVSNRFKKDIKNGKV